MASGWQSLSKTRRVQAQCTPLQYHSCRNHAYQPGTYPCKSCHIAISCSSPTIHLPHLCTYLERQLYLLLHVLERAVDHCRGHAHSAESHQGVEEAREVLGERGRIAHTRQNLRQKEAAWVKHGGDTVKGWACHLAAAYQVEWQGSTFVSVCAVLAQLWSKWWSGAHCCCRT